MLARASVQLHTATSAVLRAFLPELGQLNRRRLASLVGLAPLAYNSGRSRGPRRVPGGRPQIRRALFIAARAATRYDKRFAAFRARLETAGKGKKTAILAAACKLVKILNATLRDGKDFEPQI